MLLVRLPNIINTLIQNIAEISIFTKFMLILICGEQGNFVSRSIILRGLLLLFIQSKSVNRFLSIKSKTPQIFNIHQKLFQCWKIHIISINYTMFNAKPARVRLILPVGVFLEPYLPAELSIFWNFHTRKHNV